MNTDFSGLFELRHRCPVIFRVNSRNDRLFLVLLQPFAEAIGAEEQDGGTEGGEGEGLRPQVLQADAFEKDATNDLQIIAYGVEVGKHLDDRGHVSMGKMKPESMVAGSRKKTPVRLDSCCVFDRVEISVPSPSVVLRKRMLSRRKSSGILPDQPDVKPEDGDQPGSW